MRRGAVILSIVSILVAACGSTPAASNPASPPPSADGSAAASATSPAASATDTASASPVASPSPTPASFTFPPTPQPSACADSIHRDGTAERAQLTGLTASNATASGSVAFTFAGAAAPTVDVTPAKPPFHADPSDLIVTVGGSAFWLVVLHGGTGVDPNGVETYTGAGELRPSGAPIVDVVRLGDFEAVSSWVIGTTVATCPEVVVASGQLTVVVTAR